MSYYIFCVYFLWSKAVQYGIQVRWLIVHSRYSALLQKQQP